MFTDDGVHVLSWIEYMQTNVCHVFHVWIFRAGQWRIKVKYTDAHKS